MNGTSCADFNPGFSLDDEIPDRESTRLSEGIKPHDLTYDVEVRLPNLQLPAAANSSLFADDLGEFAASEKHEESSMVEDAPIPRDIAEDSGVVTYHCVDSATKNID